VTEHFKHAYDGFPAVYIMCVCVCVRARARVHHLCAFASAAACILLAVHARTRARAELTPQMHVYLHQYTPPRMRVFINTLSLTRASGTTCRRCASQSSKCSLPCQASSHKCNIPPPPPLHRACSAARTRWGRSMLHACHTRAAAVRHVSHVCLQLCAIAGGVYVVSGQLEMRDAPPPPHTRAGVAAASKAIFGCNLGQVWGLAVCVGQEEAGAEVMRDA